MHRDAIMEELRATRERLAAQHNYDVRALAEEARARRQSKGGQVGPAAGGGRRAAQETATGHSR